MIALGLIYDVASQRLKDMPMPAVPKPPRYDGKLARGKDGFAWMSEMLLRDLEWWEKKKRASAEEGGRYAEQNRKSADALAKWIEWRRLFPSEVWSGTRGDDRATAAPPSANPPLNDWKDHESKSGGKSKSKQESDPPASEEERGEFDVF